MLLDFPQRIDLLADKVGGKNELARRAGLGSSAVSQYSHGTTPGADALAKLVAATGCSPGWLLTGEGEPFPPADPNTAAGREAAEQMAASALDALEASAEALRAAIPFVSNAAQLVGLEARLAALLAAVQTRRSQLPPAS